MPIKRGSLIIVVLAASLLPVWRAAGRETGMNIWEYYQYVHTQEYWDLHIPYDQAVGKARDIWEEKHGEEYE